MTDSGMVLREKRGQSRETVTNETPLSVYGCSDLVMLFPLMREYFAMKEAMSEIVKTALLKRY